VEISTRALSGPRTFVFASDILKGSTTSCSSVSQQTNAARTAALVGTVDAIGLTEANNCRGRYDEYSTIFDKVWRQTPGISWNLFKAAPGNHDYLVGSAQGFRDYFQRQTPKTTYQTYTVGDTWRVYALDSNLTSNDMSVQVAWLNYSLMGNTRPCILAYFHHPRYSSGSSHTGDREKGKPLWDMLAQFKADIVLSGHEHNYERFQRIDGITQVVVGTGGSSLTGFGTIDSRSVVHRNDRYGVLRMTLDDYSYRGEFDTPEGRAVDSFVSYCQ
jgi:acid phosphatase type 7